MNKPEIPFVEFPKIARTLVDAQSKLIEELLSVLRSEGYRL